MNGENMKTALGIGLTSIFESQIFPFMLSSTFTARTIVKEKGEIEEVKKDIYIAVGFSLVFSGVLAYLLDDFITGAWGAALGFVMLGVYEWRGHLIGEHDTDNNGFGF